MLDDAAEIAHEPEAPHVDEVTPLGSVTFSDTPAPVEVKPDARVAVEHPTVTVQGTDEIVEVPQLLHVTCSEHGELTDWETTSDEVRQRFQIEAKAHAQLVHDGLVEAIGWAK